jgi:hypothetical protein
MACRKGSVNYKNEVLIKLINKILPNGEYGRQAVAIAYLDQTKEKALHNSMDIKKHWIKNPCNNMKKPMGQMGGDGDWIHQCMAIEKKIIKKTHSGVLGFSLDEGSINLDRDTENTRREDWRGG